MKKFINLTPHEINLNDGRSFPPSGKVARIKDTFSPFDKDGICDVNYGGEEDLPEAEKDIIYIVSAMVLQAVRYSSHYNCVAPATGHPDAKRNEKGQIVSVPGFVR